MLHPVALRRSHWRDTLTGYLFLAPFLVPFVLLWLVPIFNGLYLSFTNSNLVLAREDFVGLDNYQRLLRDEIYLRSLTNTVVFVVENVPLLVAGGLLLALLLNEPLLGRAAIRAAFVAPYLITGSAVAIIWQFVLDPTTGLLNAWLADAGLPGQSWLNQPGQAMWAISLITLWWRVGFPMLVILAGLQDIPRVVYEAASIDGAGALERFRFITLPLLAPVLVFVVVIRLIDSFKVFAQVYLVTAGGPAGSTRVLLQYLYEAGFKDFRVGYAAAIGWSLFLIILAVTVLQLRFFRKVEAHD
jgi:ABC-type sugar transport system permease subunit